MAIVKRTITSITMTEDVEHFLKWKAQKEGRSVSNLIDRIINREIENDPQFVRIEKEEGAIKL
uniref:Putative ribbon-helix-helix protein repressor n=1 Tax=viral metagenome TaxID=1070528 RepID=A0A6M3KLK2_9ZZZZ